MSLQDVLADLQKNYLAAIPEKIERVETLWSAGSIRELETEFHKMKGTGRTYGLPEFTTLGALMEQLCESNQAVELLKRALPTAVRLMRACRDSRMAGQPLDLSSHPDFKELNDIKS